jgi:hypothetical protein
MISKADLMPLFLPRDGFADMRFGIIPCLSTTETPLQVYGMALCLTADPRSVLAIE